VSGSALHFSSVDVRFVNNINWLSCSHLKRVACARAYLGTLCDGRESYNFSTALRQGFLQPIGSAFFYYPLALFIPTELALLHRSWNTLYQFWVSADMPCGHFVMSLGLEWGRRQ
jgi:hypothetical protein